MLKPKPFPGKSLLFSILLFSCIFLSHSDGAAIAVQDSPAPAIHGARIVGATPGRQFIFLIPATGQGPLAFSAANLPAGLSLDSKTGIISGALQKEGTSVVELSVSGPQGSAKRNLTIVGGQHKLAQTPPMGWNSWNAFGLSVSDKKVREAADAMVQSGLAAHGFQYINIDDGWEEGRNDKGEIKTNAKFPDMKALSDYVHSKGLKLGIYSSPGPKTCGGFEGSFDHVLQDATSYAAWGIDYLKYDWCSYRQIATGKSLQDYQEPYLLMRSALDSVDRDIVYSLCQYGMGNVWEWGDKVGGNLWRTTGDIRDTWKSMSKIGFAQNGHEAYAGPGHWNDPDMLVVGKVGWGLIQHESMLTKDEQITHITLWCMLSAALLIGCDMNKMDEFTVAVLTNDEALEINQDPLGQPASRKAQAGKTEVWARPLWDGTTAVALFNLNESSADVTAKWDDLGLKGSRPVRDLWQHKDLGAFEGSFTAPVPAHGSMMLKIGKPDKDDYRP